MRTADGININNNDLSIVDLCESWSLRNLEPARVDTMFLTTIQLPASIEDLLQFLQYPGEALWSPGRRRFWIQTDNLSLSQLLSGEALLGTNDLWSLFVRIDRFIHQLLRSQWKPITDVSNLVLWDKREFNTHASHAAHASLDSRHDWERTDLLTLKGALAMHANV